jgi:hypothetical protein
MREYREQERLDMADPAVMQAARRRVRAELRKGEWYVRRAGFAERYPWAFWALRIEPPTGGDVCLWRIAATILLAPQGYKPQHPSRAANRPWAYQQA